MKIIRKRPVEAHDKRATPDNFPPRQKPWKLMIVDDEPDVHQLTRLNLKGFRYAGRGVEILQANSAREAQQLLAHHPDVALALIDVVMESEDAGLRLVEFIRRDLDNRLIRLLIRTGQPGVAPERYVIDNFDIDGYHDKTDLTAQRLYTSVRSAIKSYRDLRTIDQNRIGLSHVLRATRDLYRFRSDSVREFFMGVLTQIISLFQLGESGMISTIEGLIVTVEGNEVSIQAGTGEFCTECSNSERVQEISALCSQAVLTCSQPEGLRSDCLLIPLRLNERPVGFVYLEHTSDLQQDDRDLLQIMANQCAGALENLRLHLEQKASYEHVINMLAMTAEYRDSTTGDHINRIASLVSQVALEMGMPADQAEALGKAARLHDVGKVGIPDHILNKPGKLTAEEREVVKAHSNIGADILAQDKKLQQARDIAMYHHEQWAGTGYPEGLSGEEIPLAARIVSVVDVFDALTNSRPYKNAWTLKDTISYIEQEKGNHFDPDVVEAAKRVIQRMQDADG